jgi:hypothetical protein
MILRDPSGLRDVLAEPEFVKLFGEPKAEKGKRSNIFGRDDELKNVRGKLSMLGSGRVNSKHRRPSSRAWTRSTRTSIC